MNKPNTTSKIENNVHIEQNTPQNELNNLEKTTIFQFLNEENILKEKNKKTETIKQKIIKEDIYAKINSNETHKTIENARKKMYNNFMIDYLLAVPAERIFYDNKGKNQA